MINKISRILDFNHQILLVFLVFSLSSCAKNIVDAENLFRSGDREGALNIAVSLMDSESPRVRLRAIKLIAKIGGDEANEVLRQNLRDTNEKISSAAISGIGKNRYEAAIEDMLELIPDLKRSQQKAMGNAFANFGASGITMLVEDYEQNSSPANQNSYKAVLIAVGPKIADGIIPIMKNKSYFENRVNFEILQRIRNPKVAELLLSYLWDDEVALQVIEVIGRLGSSAVDPTLRSMKRAGEDEIKVLEAHLIVLGSLKDQRAVDAIEPLSQHQSDRIRDAADHALFKIRGF